jgi:hypothetical protein
MPRITFWQWIVPKGTTWMPTPNTLASLAAGFAPISMKEMDEVALLDRTDTNSS